MRFVLVWLVILGVVLFVRWTDPAHGQATPYPDPCATDVAGCECQRQACFVMRMTEGAAQETHFADDDETATARAGEAYVATAYHARAERTMAAMVRIMTAQASDIRDLAAAQNLGSPTEVPTWRAILPALLRRG